jgi:hypothetical protein
MRKLLTLISYGLIALMLTPFIVLLFTLILPFFVFSKVYEILKEDSLQFENRGRRCYF